MPYRNVKQQVSRGAENEAHFLPNFDDFLSRGRLILLF